MTTAPARQPSEESSRPVGVVAPIDENAAGALRAIETERIATAHRYVEALSKTTGHTAVWKNLLHARLALIRSDLRSAQHALSQAFLLAASAADQDKDLPLPDAFRLAAYALNLLGKIYRRRDRSAQAYRIHAAAYRMCEQFGSLEEIWGAALELGLDAEITRNHHDAVRWYNQAIETAKQTTEYPLRKQAISWANLARSLSESGEKGEAVNAGRTALDLWRQHDSGCVETARADHTLGALLLAHGESLVESSRAKAKPLLNEAIASLTAARETLLAFGPECASDAQECGEQSDFTRRLLATFQD